MRRLLEAMANLVDKMDPPASSWEPPPPPPPKPSPHMKFKAASMEWFVRLPKPPDIHDEIRAGRVISMSALGKAAASKRRAPKAPDQQERRSNGSWWWWK